MRHENGYAIVARFFAVCAPPFSVLVPLRSAGWKFFVIDCSRDDPKVHHVALVFASTELAGEFKSAFDTRCIWNLDDDSGGFACCDIALVPHIRFFCQGKRRPGRDVNSGIVSCACGMAEIRSKTAASSWLRSGPGRRLLRGRGQVALWLLLG